MSHDGLVEFEIVVAFDNKNYLSLIREKLSMFQPSNPEVPKIPTFCELLLILLQSLISVAWFIVFLLININTSFACGLSRVILWILLPLAVIDTYLFVIKCYYYFKFNQPIMTHVHTRTNCVKALMPNCCYTLTHYPLLIAAYALSIIAYINNTCPSIQNAYLGYIIVASVILGIAFLPLLWIPVKLLWIWMTRLNSPSSTDKYNLKSIEMRPMEPQMFIIQLDPYGNPLKVGLPDRDSQARYQIEERNWKHIYA